jgi:hypothetical protein
MWPSDLKPIILPMDDCGILHRIEEELSDNWLETWAEGGVRAIEDYLAKHLAFLSFLEDD